MPVYIYLYMECWFPNPLRASPVSGTVRPAYVTQDGRSGCPVLIIPDKNEAVLQYYYEFSMTR